MVTRAQATTILIADDDLYSAKATAFVLKDCGYHTITTHDPGHILASIDTHTPDLVLIDAAIAGERGFSICRDIRKVSDIPLIFLSRLARLQDRVFGLQIGADDYLIKPIEPAELLVRIGAVLRRCGADTEAMYHVRHGSLSLSPVERMVTFANGEHVNLTRIEFRLLHYLSQNAGRTLTISQILHNVWESESRDCTNLVAVYIRRLRQKIEVQVEQPRCIETVAGIGYRFVTA